MWLRPHKSDISRRDYNLEVNEKGSDLGMEFLFVPAQIIAKAFGFQMAVPSNATNLSSCSRGSIVAGSSNGWVESNYCHLVFGWGSTGGFSSG